MSKRKIIPLAVALFCSLLVTGGVLAMFSANYRLDWLIPLSGGGGGPASSANYAVDFSVGQSAINTSTSPNYAVGLGYWYGIWAQFKIYLPAILRNSP